MGVVNKNSNMEDTATLGLCLIGVVFFCSSHFFVRKTMQQLWGRTLTEADIYVVACRFVSAIQAVISSVVGAIIASSCHDIMKDVHWLTNAYVFFGLPYFVYDLWAMYAYYIRVHERIFSDLRLIQRIQLYAMKNILMVAHHALLPAILLPMILVFRNNRGDFFFGIFCMIELVIPFISVREILIQLKMKNTKLYFYTSLSMVIVFFFCRLMVFPYLYYKYAEYAGISVGQVASAIPVKCNLACLLILAPQVYWFGLMIRGLYRVFSKLGKANNDVNNIHIVKEAVEKEHTA